jgi:predicted RNase H-like nuclease
MNAESQRPLEELVERFERLAVRLEACSSREALEREAVYRSALQEAVEVLRQTKGAFRSKQLKQLRERIEGLLGR